ncbi:mechanosensitive ion channel family protein [Comamonas resistens]|uniref:Small-conductance mechanosensitive channel n=1 Tax=Comamonas resistens TaxID=3046670 RepID=A0ABY8SU46_9BURK|nr:mechanosensitive ion channel family protein [Comamonas resistens]MDL5035352.1 mechanosensitive ion channel family protein [Comamonas resistens]WHS66587.1 mechanosensitive ion channel family protein [Comamonas resistens]
MRRLQMHLPDWMQDWLEVLIPGVQIVLIIFVAWLLNWLFKRIFARVGKAYDLPHELLMPLRGIFRWLIIAAAILAILERLGMSATVLWTAFTGFATVGAVAFFAAWSVLSNLFCAVLIVTVGPFRLGDHIEVLDTAEKPGAKGRVVDLNMLYITLQDDSAPAGTPNLLQIPNSLVFQRVIRRWKGGLPAVTENTPASAQEEACAIAMVTPNTP